MNKVIVSLVIVALIIIGVVLVSNRTPQGEVAGTEEVNLSDRSEEADKPEMGEMMDEGDVTVKEFAVNGAEFSYSPNEMKVKVGDKVKIMFMNAGKMPHNLVIDEFNVSTKILQSEGKETVEFTADKAGTFEYYCSVGDHRAKGMVGKLIVEE